MLPRKLTEMIEDQKIMLILSKVTKVFDGFSYSPSVVKIKLLMLFTCQCGVISML